MVLKERELPKTDEDKDIEKVRNECNWLIDKMNRIDKMNEEERKEILELLRKEADKTAEEHRRGEHFMDEIVKYANTLNKEKKKLFYGDLNERWNYVLREESKRLSKLWK
jgi:CHASE3 domain sensor protein